MPTHVTLASGELLPTIGLGLYKVEPSSVQSTIDAGLGHGYRLLDGAAMYGNEAAVGRAVQQSGMRDELFVTTKFWGDPEQSAAAAVASLDASERDFGGTFDCFMIHWPRAPRNRFVETFRALQELRDAGRVRVIGVSNFNEHELQRLFDETGEYPAINQVETHPWLQQRALRSFHDEHGIITQAWSPLGRGKLLQDATLIDIAAKHDCSVAQVILAWHVRMGGTAVVKSTHEARIAENIQLQDVSLTESDMTAIADLETGEHTGTRPEDRP